ncbi:hypothetical protein ACCUM_4456 [Candidatus Accumulibacter phosphatis]|uniref:Uncharacterized protein n=1 Tax=Candidatus Accumulibacter phosphatis TaxID=327160 RepID=A0A5S4ELU2_9PROT|nr:hypothetical protein ACCUM_4456 [Candidatus Accumulibacter phosphatis]
MKKGRYSSTGGRCLLRRGNSGTASNSHFGNGGLLFSYRAPAIEPDSGIGLHSWPAERHLPANSLHCLSQNENCWKRRQQRHQLAAWADLHAHAIGGANGHDFSRNPRSSRS